MANKVNKVISKIPALQTLIFLKIIVGTIVFFAFRDNLDMWIYPDFKIYSDCTQRLSNILYTKSLCWSGINTYTHLNSFIPSSYSIFINTLACSLIYLVMHKYIGIKSKLIFLILLVFHPYLLIYSIRFYSDIFGILGIALISFYAIKERKVDYKFIVISIILMNFRTALIPCFFIYAAFEIFDKEKLKPLLLTVGAIASLILYQPFASIFISIEYDYANPLFNLFALFSLRESFALNPLIIENSDYLFITIFFIVHVIGLVGFIKFVVNENKIKLLSVLMLFIPSLISISHMRYLYPFLPLVLFGLLYLFNNRIRNAN